jgi:hypothetical protein
MMAKWTLTPSGATFGYNSSTSVLTLNIGQAALG